MGERRAPVDPAPDASPEAAGAPGFEASLVRLEALVERLEGGELELEGALACFEAGVALARRCAAQLEQAEQRIDVLLREGGELATRPLAASEEGEGD